MKNNEAENATSGNRVKNFVQKLDKAKKNNVDFDSDDEDEMLVKT